MSVDRHLGLNRSRQECLLGDAVMMVTSAGTLWPDLRETELIYLLRRDFLKEITLLDNLQSERIPCKHTHTFVLYCYSAAILGVVSSFFLGGGGALLLLFFLHIINFNIRDLTALETCKLLITNQLNLKTQFFLMNYTFMNKNQPEIKYYKVTPARRRKYYL